MIGIGSRNITTESGYYLGTTKIIDRNESKFVLTEQLMGFRESFTGYLL